MSSVLTLSGPVEGPLAERVLMLNTEKAPRFQCFGFIVTRNSPIQIVPKNAQEQPLRRALEAGILLDVTNSSEGATGLGKVAVDLEKAVKEGNISKVDEEAVGPQILIGKDARGNSYVIIPKDEADFERMQEELRTTGHIRREKPKTSQFTGLSALYEEDLPPLDRIA